MTLKQYIRQTYKEGQIFSFKDLPEPFRKPSSIVQLSRFVKAQEIGKLMKGVYYIPSKGKLFDKLPPLPQDIDYFFCKKFKGYLSGADVFNKMGLTEQVPSAKHIYSMKPVSSVAYKGGRYVLKKAHLSPRGRDVSVLQILDALSDIFIPGASREQVDERISSLIKSLDEERKKKMIIYSKSYPEETRNRLSQFL